MVVIVMYFFHSKAVYDLYVLDMHQIYTFQQFLHFFFQYHVYTHVRNYCSYIFRCKNSCFAWFTMLPLSILKCLFPAQRDQEEIKDEEMEIFSKLFDEWKGTKPKDDKSFKTIPKFYFKVLFIL